MTGSSQYRKICTDLEFKEIGGKSHHTCPGVLRSHLADTPLAESAEPPQASK